MKPYARLLAAAAFALLTGLGLAQEQPKPSASHLEVARVVVTASGIARSFDGMIPGFVQQVRRTLVTRPELSKDLEEIFVKITPEFEATKQELVETAARLYAKNLSEPELKEIAAFFNSAAGKRYVETQPLVINEMYAELETWSQKTSGALVERIRAEMKARGKPF